MILGILGDSGSILNSSCFGDPSPDQLMHYYKQSEALKDKDIPTRSRARIPYRPNDFSMRVMRREEVMLRSRSIDISVL
jgi:hypothetical protein